MQLQKKKQKKKKNYPVCMVMVKLASINTFIPSDNRKALISIKVYGYSVFFFNHHVVAFLL